MLRLIQIKHVLKVNIAVGVAIFGLVSCGSQRGQIPSQVSSDQTGLLAPSMPPEGAGAEMNGGQDAGGGDGTAIEFKMQGYQLVTTLKLSKGSTFYGVDLDVFESVISKAKIKTVKTDLSLNGVRKDALNYPSKGLIVISSPGWKRLSDVTKQQLAAHEFLRLMKVDDVDYHCSSKLIAAFLEASPEKRVVRQLRLEENRCLKIVGNPDVVDCLDAVQSRADRILKAAVKHVEKSVLPRARPERRSPGAAIFQFNKFMEFREADVDLATALLAGTGSENAVEASQTRLEQTIDEIRTMTWLE